MHTKHLLLMILPLWLIGSSLAAPTIDSGKEGFFCPERVTFFAEDSTKVFGNLYTHNPEAPIIALFHQARSNKSEYFGIAQRLVKLGFNCLAIDQRSGGNVMDFRNETVENLDSIQLQFLGKNPIEGFIAAEMDMKATIQYLANRFNQKVIVWGSSYSSTLALYQGVSNDLISAVIAFSPGHYLDEKKGSLRKHLAGCRKPLFLTSSLKESSGEGGVDDLIQEISKTDKQIHFIPTAPGKHGSSALWISNSNSEEYWAALSRFLRKL